MLAQELSLDTSNTEKDPPSFPDINGHWSEKYIEALIDAGIIDPADYPDGFRPDDPRPPPSSTVSRVKTSWRWSGMVTGSGPQAKVRIPPPPASTAAATARSAASVQLPGVPSPTTAVGEETSRRVTGAGQVAGGASPSQGGTTGPWPPGPLVALQPARRAAARSRWWWRERMGTSCGSLHPSRPRRWLGLAPAGAAGQVRLHPAPGADPRGRQALARVLVTGSADGLGQLAARQLLSLGHQVVLHARSRQRAREALAALPGAQAALVGDLSSLAEVRALAEQARAAGPLDAVIQNAGVYREERREATAELPRILVVNLLAPYLLTALCPAPRLVYLTSGMHRGGDPDLSDLGWRRRRWSSSQAYSDSKLLVTTLAFAVARRWPGVRSNAVDPGWVPTRMGGPGAPDDLAQGAETQAWLASSDDPAAAVSGRCFFHRRPRTAHPAASDPAVQEGLLRACQELTGAALPAEPFAAAGR